MKLRKVLVTLLAGLMIATPVLGCGGGGGGDTITPYEGDDIYLQGESLKATDDAYYTRFTESWRSVKQEGWSINKNTTGAELDRALKLFDYMYSKAGNTLMSYGPSAMIDGTIEYFGRQVPRLSDAMLADLLDKENGNYTNYYRHWMGGTMPVGYVKEQGMEYQTTHAKGRDGLDNILKGIELNTMGHIQVSAGGDTFEYQDLETPLLPTTAAVTLDMAVLYQDKSQITFNIKNFAQGATYAAPDGETYGIGDLKPVWRELGENLNVTFVNKVDSNATNVATNFTALVKNNAYETTKNNWDVITGSATDLIDYGVGTTSRQGIFVNLLDHMDKMPNLKAFLDANPFIKTICLAGDGALYYAPYFDGYDDIERMFMMRADWVEKLLDGATAPTFDTAQTLTTYYTPFMPETMTSKSFKVVNNAGTAAETITKSYTKNIISIQNDLATKNGKTLTEALRSYIDSTYGARYGTNRSKLFTGANAAYDVDELIALLRCVETNPALLTGNASTDIIPIYPRNNTADRTMDIFRFMSNFGVRGLDGRNNFTYVDENGVLQDTRFQTRTLAALDKLNEMYKEKLILQDFIGGAAVGDTTYFTGDNSFRGKLNQNNRGFMTYDYNQTTTVVNALGEGETPTIAGFNLTPVLPAFTDWGYTAAPTATDKRLNPVPTALPYTKSTQTAINGFTHFINNASSRFYLNSGNGKDGANSDFLWSDLIMNGFGSAFEKGTTTYNFQARHYLYNQLTVEWRGAQYQAINDTTYQVFAEKMA